MKMQPAAETNKSRRVNAAIRISSLRRRRRNRTIQSSKKTATALNAAGVAHEVPPPNRKMAQTVAGIHTALTKRIDTRESKWSILDSLPADAVSSITMPQPPFPAHQELLSQSGMSFSRLRDYLDCRGRGRVDSRLAADRYLLSRMNPLRSTCSRRLTP